VVVSFETFVLGTRERERIVGERLYVPVRRAIHPIPVRAGWTPAFVSVMLDHPVQKVVIYRRELAV
jgi:hypothetical protein